MENPKTLKIINGPGRWTLSQAMFGEPGVSIQIKVGDTTIDNHKTVVHSISPDLEHKIYTLKINAPVSPYEDVCVYAMINIHTRTGVMENPAYVALYGNLKKGELEIS
ncbi:MAG: hypothetical protein ACI9GH_000371 [Candidatus Paceibacteria bacterium]|jgi:hypothetical protein